MSTSSVFTAHLRQFGTRVEKAIAHSKQTAAGSNKKNSVNEADSEALAAKEQARVWTELVAQAERVKREAQQLLDACFEGRASASRLQQPPPLTALVSAITAELANMQSQSDILSATIAAASAAPLQLPESARKAAPSSSTKKRTQSESSPARSSSGSIDENSSSNTSSRSIKKSASSASVLAGKPAAIKKKLVLSSAAKAPRPSSAVTPGKKGRASVAPAVPSYISPAKLAQTHRRLSIERQKQAAAAAEAKLIAESELESMHEGDEAKTDSDAAHTDDDAMPVMDSVDGIVMDSAVPSTPAQPTRSTLLESPPTPDFANDALSEATRRLLESRSVGLAATSAAASSSSSSAAAPRTPGAIPNRMAPSLTVDSPATPELACVQLLANNQAVRAARKNGATPAAAAAAARKMSLLGAPRESLAPRTPGAVVATPARTLFPTATPMSSRARSGQLSRQSLGLPANSNAAAGLPSSPAASSMDALAPLRFGLLPGAAASSSSSAAVFSAGLGDDSLLLDGGLSTSMSMSNSLLATPVLKHQAGTTATLTQLLADPAHDAPSPAPLGELHSAKKKRASSSMQQQRALAASASPPHRRRSPAAASAASSSSSAASLAPSPPLSAALTSPAGSSIPTLVLPSAAAATPRSNKKNGGGLKTPKSSVRKSSKLTAAAGPSASKIPMLVLARSASASATEAPVAAAASSAAAPSTPAQEEKASVSMATPSSPVLLSALSASFANSPAAVLAITSELTGPASAVKARRAATAK